MPNPNYDVDSNVVKSVRMVDAGGNYLDGTGTPYKGTPLGYINVAANSFNAGYTLIPPAGAKYAIILPEGTGVRWRDDAIAPTLAVGMPLYAGQQLIYSAVSLSALVMFPLDAATSLNIVYYK